MKKSLVGIACILGFVFARPHIERLRAGLPGFASGLAAPEAHSPKRATTPFVPNAVCYRCGRALQIAPAARRVVCGGCHAPISAPAARSMLKFEGGKFGNPIRR